MIAAGVVSGQTARKPAATEDEPAFHEYRGVKLGWLADEVRLALEQRDLFTLQSLCVA